MTLEELEKKHQCVKQNADNTLENMEMIINETNRVADVAHNAEQIIDSLDREFEEKTGLKGIDVAFLFLATGLQMARIFLVNHITKIEKAGATNVKENKIHEFQEFLLKKFKTGSIVNEKPYYASFEHIVTRYGVPYDATAFQEYEPLFKGANHRFSTMGHDPVLGLIFGTANIMTNTITCVKKSPIIYSVKVPILTTNNVIYDSEYKHPKIGMHASTIEMFRQSKIRTFEEPKVLIAALIKQVAHIATDLYTPMGIQIPGANLVLSNRNVERLTKYISMGDMLKVGASAKFAEFINIIIRGLHLLLYDENRLHSHDVYEVKTRKIIHYSNLIATSSNVIWTSGKVIAGNESAYKDFDIGGLIVTINHLLNDKKFIRQVKEEFVLGGFNKIIQGEDLDFK